MISEIAARTTAVRRCLHLIRYGLHAAVCGVALLAAGCGGSVDGPAGTLEGQVTYGGEPVREGVVSVYSEALGVGASAPLDEEGRYTISDPLAVGDYAVVVLPPQEPPPQDDSQAAVSREFKNIPAKYRDYRSSGLALHLDAGDNTFDVAMTP